MMKEEKTPEVKQHTEAVAPAPKKDTAKMVWMIVAIVAILALIGSIAYGYMSMKKLNDEITSQKSQISDLQNTKKTLEDAASAAATAATNAAAKAVGNAISSQTDDQQIATAAKNYSLAKDVNIKSAEVSVAVKEGNFARVVVTPSPAQNGYVGVMILKKQDGSWVVVYQGSGQPSAKEAQMLGLPNNGKWY